MVSPLTYLLLAGGLAAVHLFAGRLRFLEGIPRNRYLSLAGGVSVAYVFIHALPEIADHQDRLITGGDIIPTVSALAGEQAIFLVALVGFASFYGLEQLATQSRRTTEAQLVAGKAETRTASGVFWLHIGSFGLYNTIIGYLLVHREETGVLNLLLYATAMALHFVVNDTGLREHHQSAYTRIGRWILAASVLVGVLVGLATVVSEPVVSLLFGFLAGGVILNVIKEELPEQRESSFWAFSAGLTGYTIILLLL